MDPEKTAVETVEKAPEKAPEKTVNKPVEKVAESFDEVDVKDSEIFIDDEEQPVSTEKKSEVKTEKPEPGSTETPTDTKEKEKEKSAEQPEPEPEAGKTGDDKDKAGEEPEKEAAPAEPVFKVGEKVYTEVEMKKFIEDSVNKEDWKKVNTEKAQETAAERKAVEPIVQLIEKLKGKPAEAIQAVKEELIEVLGEEAKSIIDTAFNFDAGEYPNPYKKELDEEREKNAELEGEKAVDAALSKLAEDHKLSDAKKKEVHEFWLKKYNETGEVLEFEDAYKLMDYETQKKKAEEKKKPEIPKVPEKKAGAKNIESKPATSFEDIDISEAIRQD